MEVFADWEEAPDTGYGGEEDESSSWVAEEEVVEVYVLRRDMSVKL